MLFFGGALGLVAVAVWIFCVVDVITTPETQVRSLPKLAWVFIVLLFMDIGAIAWLLGGRPWTKVPANGPAGQRSTNSRLGGRAPASQGRASNPDDDEEFLASLRKRAEDQRRRTRDDQGNGRIEGDPT